MSVIVFATGGTTSKARTIEHPWENYEFVISRAAQALSPLFSGLEVHSVANCLTAGNLWGGFLFAHEICRQLRVRYYPFASVVDCEALCEAVSADAIDTIICLPSFAERLLVPERRTQLASVRNIFYLGEMFPDTLVAKAQRLLPGICIKPLAYTSQETGPIGFQCMHISGNHYHIYKHVNLVQKQPGDEFSVTINYPGRSHLLDHSMGDVGDILRGNTCPCGYTGDSIHLQGRIPTSRNILGTSISIHEFVRTLSDISAGTLTETDLQLVEVEDQAQGLGLVLMVCCNNLIASDQISERLKSSSLIRELINDASYFHVLIAGKHEFLKSETTHKIKPFIRTRIRPAEKTESCLVIK
ncbi:TPA_asm: long-chain fatty acid--CoA ligase [Salmonella enterica subsp. houtenae serovar 45:g,z51:-]|uniref:Long-chain fatty acid--CoA ligase n=1 Tax=Salmonella enterica subsp. houtenae serovar 45:g,z51:- TaxID=1967611 RepID=A0A736RDC2_SALHO|nr:long-chain fatty acid--CoA ligase [Salmonella enterica subsp. houtenae str. CFSAN000557]HAE7767785.1 long-chain fatty acid--CoA ligase [Salmonella enterica subsp. houtenae serovar 45:g,z51:-]